jgi:HAD superfamily hydrolase (TIGR01509 family)
MPTELHAVLWDMDGTLVDSEPAWIQAQRHVVERFGGEWTEVDGLTLVGASMEETVTAMQRAGVELDSDHILETLERDVASAFRRKIVWQPGATQLVRDLSLSGIPQAIVTTSPRRLASLVVASLARHGQMTTIVTGDDVTRPKPDPEGYLLAARRLQVDIAQCIAIEDSENGLRAAESSGAVTVRLSTDASHRSNPKLTPWRTLEGRTAADLRALIRS